MAMNGRKAVPVQREQQLTPDGTIQALARGIEVLERLADEPGGVGLSELARATRLAKPVVLRILRTWEKAGYVRRGQGGTYQFGWRIFTLAAARSQLVDIRDVARPYLADLNKASRETVHLAVLAGSHIIYVDKIEGQLPIRVYTAIGRHAPVYATASGKAILAWQPDSYYAEHFARPLTRYNDRTLVSREELSAEAGRTRLRGYSINGGEWHEEVGGIGAAIREADGGVNAALSITPPISRLTQETIPEFARWVIDAAKKTSRDLGWPGEGHEAQVNDATGEIR